MWILDKKTNDRTHYYSNYRRLVHFPPKQIEINKYAAEQCVFLPFMSALRAPRYIYM